MVNHHGEVSSHDYYHHHMHANQHPHVQQSHTPDGPHRRPDVPLGQAPVLGGGPVGVAPQASLFANASNGLSGDNQVKLADYWQRTITDIETREHDFKSHALPLARIKKVMKADEEVKMISAEAPILFAKGCEIFITELTMRAWIHAEENKRRTLQRSDIANAISRSDMFDFLIDIVPRDEFAGSANNEGPDATPVAGAAGGFMGMSLGHPGMQLHPASAPHLQVQEPPRPDTGDSHYYNHAQQQQLKHEESGGSNGHYAPHPQHAPHNLHPQHPQHPGSQQQQQHLRQQQQQHPHHGMFDHNRYPMPPIGMPAMSHNGYMDHLGYGGGGGYPHANNNNGGGPPQYGNPYSNPYAAQQQQQQPPQQQQQPPVASLPGLHNARNKDDGDPSVYGR